ncbi:bifunctional methylenetetrahydrofolate dehydrogenase/methenyltetrahydrofolate cyclohydrolase FolD [Vagococcus intermedius]|uniref:Bifunctional protein FolD n=1 Tax=Vagococcus intermedius TaxID=2991418 RepID=A0AAF0I6V7_9ENTE|nr:bifunctional methylenetetrahydrofolate dehydrogenase/methenyltetrahydrofolate cyclohydrolase FolD [Vagococcus intermedius]WEG73843.1 bifunctional methylenetetrahydrofolate dehydrogenase/methenyltetrahydrofolate cyclohydrolase FolD [Vagococcus intermedius]WEG75928.1 bifunctional methylenetetrahydrofolate dehydrogenase/methenyltetrahydrofolate cyclohydrolase FolD [Vagococcus intermedius]
MGNKISGRKLADEMQLEMAAEVSAMTVKPGLVVIIVGENKASQTYVRNKERTAEKIGINSKIERLPETTTEEDLLSLIAQYNQDEQFHGILVQLPLPEHIDEQRVLLAIDPDKDVDGFHPLNVGKLLTGQPGLLPCTPYGIIKMLQASGVEMAGKQAVVVGRSNIVGKPMMHLLLREDATVTVTHSKTVNLKEITRQADILIVAIGRGHFIKADHIKPGAVVVDVGMNHTAEGKLIGDVEFETAQEVASLITPVPGGVGPMTITMLMEQTISNARKKDK